MEVLKVLKEFVDMCANMTKVWRDVIKYFVRSDIVGEEAIECDFKNQISNPYHDHLTLPMSEKAGKENLVKSHIVCKIEIC